MSVWNALWHGEIAWGQHLWTTTVEIIGAFFMAAIVGVALGVAIAWSPLLANALVPFLVFVNTLPKVAVAPLFLIWMGYGIFLNMLMGALIGFFPVVINTAVGLCQVEPDMLDLGRVFNAPKWKIFVKIRIPNALPYILSALKITATAAVVGAIVGEFVASQRGLGYVIVATQSSTNTSVAFAALVWISVVGLAALRRRRIAGASVGPVGRGRRLSVGDGKKGDRDGSYNVACARSTAGDLRRRVGAGEVHLRAQLVPGRRPCRLLGGARQGLLQGQGPRRDPGEFQGLGRCDRHVDIGRADAGLADTAVVIASVGRGTTVKTVGMVFDQTPLNIFSLKSSPLLKPKDLEGASRWARLRATANARSSRPSPSWNGIDATKVTWVNVEPSAKIAAVAEKRMDGVGDYSTGLPLYEKAAGKGNVVMMKWSDFGFDLYSMSIIASAKTMKDRPTALKDFLEASYMGWRDVMNDPERRRWRSSRSACRRSIAEASSAPNMLIGLEPHQDRPLRQERHRLDRGQEDVRPRSIS